MTNGLKHELEQLLQVGKITVKEKGVGLWTRLGRLIWPSHRLTNRPGSTRFDRTPDIVLMSMLFSVAAGSILSFFLNQLWSNSDLINVLVIYPLVCLTFLYPIARVLAQLDCDPVEVKKMEQLPDEPNALAEVVESRLWTLIQTHREKALGEGSEFHALRARLDRARCEALDLVSNLGRRVSEGAPYADELGRAESVVAQINRGQDSLTRQWDAISDYFRACEGRLPNISSEMKDSFYLITLDRLEREAGQATDQVETVGVRTANRFL